MEQGRYVVRAGFTIAELIIVVVVIGILAAITVISYDNMQNKAHDTAVQSDFNSLRDQLAIDKAASGVYMTYSELQTEGIKFTEKSYDRKVDNLIYFRGDTGYVMVAQSKSGARMAISSKYNDVRPYTGPWYVSTSSAMRDYLISEYGVSGSVTLSVRLPK